MADSLSRILVETHELSVSFFIHYYLCRYGAAFKPADHKIQKSNQNSNIVQKLPNFVRDLLDTHF